MAKTFAKELASRFTVTPDKTRIALVDFSMYTKIVMKFKDLYSLEKVKEEIGRVRSDQSSTRMSEALQATQNEVFSSEAGARVKQHGRSSHCNPFTPKFKTYILPTIQREMYKWCSENGQYNHLSSEKAMKSRVLH